ncbi:hypothetical protein ASE67_06055 [Sphingomonas sp. Leaf23]|nr:hypothetical protein ASE67_06055 [Sphingomonas sp. Leaf23]
MFGWFGQRDRPKACQYLRPGRLHRVIRAFVDLDGLLHPVGETWTFLRCEAFLQEEGISWIVAMPDGSELQIRLQRRPYDEHGVLEYLDDHVLPAARPGEDWPLLVMRDSVCLADDVDAPHACVVDVPRDADATGVARALLSSGCLAGVAGHTTWSIAMGRDRVVFGDRWGLRFVRAVRPDPLTARAEAFERIDVRYWQQRDAQTVIAALTGQ